MEVLMWLIETFPGLNTAHFLNARTKVGEINSLIVIYHDGYPPYISSLATPLFLLPVSTRRLTLWNTFLGLMGSISLPAVRTRALTKMDRGEQQGCI